MSVARPQGSGSEKRNGGTVVAAGNVSASGPIANVLDLVEVNGSKRSYGSKVIADTNGGASNADPHGVTKALSSGSLAYTPAKGSNFLLRLAGDTNAGKVNGSSSTVLSVGGNKTPVSIHKLNSTRKLGAYSSTVFNVLAVPNGDVVPGRTKGANAGNQANYVQMDGSTAATDDAASPSRSVPGELTYMFGGKSPKSDDYKARNSYES